MPEPLDLTGTKVGRYRVLSLLGRGGMGAVYEAIDPSLGRRVALKILPPDATSDPKRLARFIQEARSASALNHPHLVSIYEIGEQSGPGGPLHFIAMEKIDGVTLRDHLGTQRLPLKRALELFQQITDAVAAAHGAGIVHRDLKPENVMVSHSGYVKVLDFGLAKLQADTASPGDLANADTVAKSTESGTVLGTVGYMSPEQTQGRSADNRSDIFSLGCILYELVTGRRAFRGPTAIDTLHQILHSEPAPLGDATGELQRIVRKALAKNPEERYQSAKDLTIDVRELLRERPSDTAPSQEPARMKPSGRWWLFAAAVLIGAIVIAVIVMRHGTRPTDVQMRRLTLRGDVIGACISADGKFMAYVAWTDKGQTLVLRQLATGQDLELIPPSAAFSSLETGYWGIPRFTPDGNAILFQLKSPSEPQGALYRISTLGGRPEHVLDGIGSCVSFSPNGKRFTYVREDFPRPGESALMVAAIDGAAAHAIAIRRPPERFAPIFFTAPAWSPDGRVIAAAVQNTGGSTTARVLGFDPDSGAESVIASSSWKLVSQVAWLPGGKALIVVASDVSEKFPPAQIWLFDRTTNAARRLTHDYVQYRSLSVTEDGKSVLTIAFERTSSIWRVPVGQTSGLAKVTSGSFDGFTGLSYLPDGRIVFSSLEGRRPQLCITNPDAGTRTPIRRDGYDNNFPTAFSGGIAYISSTPEGNEVCVTSFEGEGRRVIARGVDDDSPVAVSHDGRWVVYSVSGHLRRSLVAGGLPTQLVAAPASGPAFSPTGDRIAFYYRDGSEYRLAVMPTEGDRVTWSIPITAYSMPTVRWDRGGDALFVNAQGHDISNIWKQPFSGPAEKVTGFVEQYAVTFDISPDDKSVMLARAEVSRDAVLITGFN